MVITSVYLSVPRWPAYSPRTSALSHSPLCPQHMAPYMLGLNKHVSSALHRFHLLISRHPDLSLCVRGGGICKHELSLALAPLLQPCCPIPWPSDFPKVPLAKFSGFSPSLLTCASLLHLTRCSCPLLTPSLFSTCPGHPVGPSSGPLPLQSSPQPTSLLPRAHLVLSDCCSVRETPSNASLAPLD